MERFSSLICFALILTFLSCGFWPAPAVASQEEIITRLRYDLREAQERNRRLEQQLEQLQRENQELRDQLADLPDIEPAEPEPEQPDETPVVSPDPVDDPVETVDLEKQPEAVQKLLGTIRHLEPDGAALSWEYGPDRAYPILARPLDQELAKRITEDDSLSRLAHQFYRNAAYWEPLYDYNRELIPDVKSLPGGREIKLPPISQLHYMLD